ncbi:MAG TPA: serine/threonine-protein kinase, partial [Polyangiaceae bacterium]|nr:serine/threonine-protein kinase [Polyangiaceae bacterium]
MDAQTTSGVRQGDILAGKYRIEKVLGIGGMGVVVAAHHLQLETKVAIKFLLPDSLGNEEVVARFRREAQAASRIKSEFVARVSDVGNLETGAPYMVMEYLEGCDLGEWLQRNGRLPIEQAVEFVLQAMEAIAEAHSLGVVHRDLKPANMYCIRRADGLLSIKVLDFGISKLTHGAASESALSMTRTSAVVGSPLYMSPEQLRSSRDVDMRTDIWSLGVILFQLLTGKAPFEGESLPDLSINIASRATPRIRDLRPEVPEALEQVIGKCLEKEREHRFSNVAELAMALAPLGPPRRAQASAERIARTLQAAGLSSPAFNGSALAPREPTGAAWGQTSPPPA